MEPWSRRPCVAAHARPRQARDHAGDDGEHQHARQQPEPPVHAEGDGRRHARVHQGGRVGAAHPRAQRAAAPDDAGRQVPRDGAADQGARPRCHHPDLDRRPRAARPVRGRGGRQLADGPAQPDAGDGELHAGLGQPRPDRVPERREANEGHGAALHRHRHQAAGRGLRHEHDHERVQPRQGRCAPPLRATRRATRRAIRSAQFGAHFYSARSNFPTARRTRPHQAC